MVASPDAIRALVEPPLISSGLELWDVEVSRDTVRILVDRPGGVDLEALAALAGKVVSPLLDDHPELTPDGQFALEVSSPGVERNLRRLEHYRRYVGSEISVKTTVAVEGSRRYQGTLLSADHDGIVVAPNDGGAPARRGASAHGGAPARAGRTLAIRHADIDRARTVLVWGPAPKPGGKPGAKASGGSAAQRGREKQDAPTPQGTDATQAVKRPAANGRTPAAQPVASREKESE